MTAPLETHCREEAEKAIATIENLCLLGQHLGLSGSAVSHMLIVTTDLLEACGTTASLKERALSLQQVLDSFYGFRGVERREGWAMKVRHVVLLECHAMRLLLRTGISPSFRPDWTAPTDGR